MNYPFTEEQAVEANKVWGANCGPMALAFALQIGMDAVRPLIPDFEAKRYTSPTMMKAALANAGRKFVSVEPKLELAFLDMGQPALVRVQWHGPWTAPGSNPRWAYGYTHWITTWRQEQSKLVFDCNGGAMTLADWEREIVPAITGSIKRATGAYSVTHVWQLLPEGWAK